MTTDSLESGINRADIHSTREADVIRPAARTAGSKLFISGTADQGMRPKESRNLLLFARPCRVFSR